ncbi:MAG: peptide chain release factor N(5)-glutamine methyltransferase [Bacteroidia bacterium]|nr:peptide chain release factor N(5)-glutamine methyltransferase [Bacteroidia bacterium]
MNNSQNTINRISNFIKKELAGLYPEREIQNFIYMIFEEALGYSKVDLYANSNLEIPDEGWHKIRDITCQLKNHKPIQYIFGKTEFYNLEFTVTPDVLIPRQETEELVDWIIQETGSRLVKILDIGTGSGCIAVALNKNIFRSKVDAFDISEKIITLATENGFKHNSLVNFFVGDILNWPLQKFDNNYDIIVSNPPYVRESEKQQMRPNVLNYEPATALFVPNDNPLIFYQTITDFATKHLKNNGRIYFELNEYLYMDVKLLLLEKGFQDIELKKDLNGKYRMIRGIRQ